MFRIGKSSILAFLILSSLLSWGQATRTWFRAGVTPINARGPHRAGRLMGSPAPQPFGLISGEQIQRNSVRSG
jgi:hypothetical protein